MESVKKVQIYPSNRASSASIYSAREGNPQINFTIGNQPMWLDSSSLTISFTLRLRTDAGLLPNNDDQSGAGTTEVRNNAHCGAMSVFESISITNANNNQLEFVRSLPRLAATIIPYRSNFDDYANDLQYSFGACSNTEAQGMLNNTETQVTAPILAGMFLGQDLIPLGDMGTGGLTITFNLAASIETLFGANAAGSYYQVINPVIRCNFVKPVGGQLPTISNYPYLAYSSYYNTIATNDETQNINCNLASVLSTFTNFVPTSWIANSLVDGNSTYELMDGDLTPGIPAAIASQVPITRYSMLRSAMQYPYRFQVDETSNVLTSPAAPGGYQTVFEAQLQRNAFTGAGTALKDMTNSLVGNISEGTQALTPLPVLDQHYNSQNLKCFSIGGRYDGLGTGEGANFVNRPFSQRIESRFTPTSGTPVSSYTFMLSKHMLSFDDRGSAALAN
jgi:hypothetical protein